MVIEPKVRGFICTTSHPVGCAAHVDEQIAHVKSKGPVAGGPKRVLVIGASTGYGLASRIAAAFGSGAATFGVYFERPAEGDRPASAGWYNTAAFTARAKSAGLVALNENGDAFGDALKEKVVARLAAEFGPVDLVVYSLASPKRQHPKTGELFSSTLKPIGKEFTNKTVDTQKGTVREVSIAPASVEEIRHTVAVMGGEDWKMWMDLLKAKNLLAPGAMTVAYSYIGPNLTYPIYRHGTIGAAKSDLEKTTKALDDMLRGIGGRAFVSVNKALVTQASSAIPVVPLYISLLYKVMKAKGLHEGCIEQMDRLFRDFLYTKGEMLLDDEGRIRVDDWEMREDVQVEVEKMWAQVNTENFAQVADLAGYQADFLKLFGFGVAGVDYAADVNPVVDVPA